MSINPQVKLPDRRFRIAQRAVTSGRALLPREIEQSTRAFARYLRKEAECTNDAARQRLRQRHRNIATAVDIYRDPSREMATLLESLVLARESTESIAGWCGISRAAVVWYRYCFFSVGGWLNNAGYIVEYAIRPELRRGGDDAHRHYIMKLMSFFCGSKVLSEFFQSGYISVKQQWQTPASFLEKIAAAVDVQLAFALGESPGLSTGIDPCRLRKWFEQTVKNVAASCPAAWPSNTIERTTWATSSGAAGPLPPGCELSAEHGGR